MRFDLSDFDIAALAEDLEPTNQVYIEFASTNKAEWVTLHVEQLTNSFDCGIEHWLNGEVQNDTKSDRFIARSLLEIVLTLKNFIILI
ncbi:hypothetical protein VITU102760_24870 [Vibrio tubiashii]|uniref:Uncharacterized protein n=2 Tax=Vibrio tubiashii TaxID=29498 RepID=F9T6R8_9VIBR|nr:hypothetical protein [Vibrio tubiashii]AIW17482.1 hypothetical protein IX91_25840 [Vibrio tubiashii ATCC 19109]EGU54473.1 hypothetical protein VITU9109_02827 [Vibrio tubiashii ATCC 19109]EIF06004.1 hypothetical protein VT1337_00655 [Vibrio tubiashii NCIMB 1337 = ATCC 19106]